MRKHTKISLKIVKGRQRLSTPLANVVLLQRDSFFGTPSLLCSLIFISYPLSAHHWRCTGEIDGKVAVGSNGGRIPTEGHHADNWAVGGEL